MNGKDMKFILPLAMVIVIILAIIGIAMMSGPKQKAGRDDSDGPYTLAVGPVTDESGEPLEDAIISIKDDSEVIGTVVTDSSGVAKFIFNEKVEDGEYVLLVSKEDYTDEEYNISLDQTKDEITLTGLNESGIELIPEPLPPLEFTVGPISGTDGILSDVDVKLLLEDNEITVINTDSNGNAVFTFDTPPENGLYQLILLYEDYETKTIDISILYDEFSHTLTVAGDITNIILTPILPIEPPEPVDDPNYYKDLDAYKELEGSGRAPVDVEEELDPDGDGNPEYYSEIEAETSDQEVEIDQYISLDSEGNPAYSMEISEIEQIDPDPYIGSGRSSRSTEESGDQNTRAEAEPKNLTHYSEFIDEKNIVDDGTSKIMNYKTDAVETTMASEFTAEVAQVAVIINNSLKIAFINGTNATDKNNDSNPEHLVIWKAVFLKQDRNNDNKTDKIVIAVQIFEMFDNNSNGIFEFTRGFMAAKIALDNDYNGTFEDIKVAVALSVEAKIDGNITNHFRKVAVFYNHTIDKNNDSNYEFQRAAIYVQYHLDNNSNGNYELQREFAGGFEGIDNNSNGNLESALLVWAGKELIDKKDNGNPDHNRSIVWIYYCEDKNEDLNCEIQALLVRLHESFDNTSNGNVEDSREVIGGIRVTDKNSDGKHEKRDAVLAMKRELDQNDDGTMDANASYGHVFLWRDTNGDNVPEMLWALHYFEANYDNNSNGNFELKRNLIVGYYLVDNNSNSKLNEVYAVHYGIEARDRNDDGKEDWNQSFAYLIHLKDSDDDGNIEVKQAVFGYENKWDNNTDGKFDAVAQFMAGYEGLDKNDDGKIDEEKFFILTNVTVDKNNDGNPEIRTFGIYAAYKKYNASGGLYYARQVLHLTVAYDNNTNGIIEQVVSIILGHEGFNGTTNSTNASKIDWETEHLLLFYTKLVDANEDGTWDAGATVTIKVKI
jgi:hypothetical protein